MEVAPRPMAWGPLERVVAEEGGTSSPESEPPSGARAAGDAAPTSSLALNSLDVTLRQHQSMYPLVDVAHPARWCLSKAAARRTSSGSHQTFGARFKTSGLSIMEAFCVLVHPPPIEVGEGYTVDGTGGRVLGARCGLSLHRIWCREIITSHYQLLPCCALQ